MPIHHVQNMHRFQTEKRITVSAKPIRKRYTVPARSFVVVVVLEDGKLILQNKWWTSYKSFHLVKERLNDLKLSLKRLKNFLIDVF